MPEFTQILSLMEYSYPILVFVFLLLNSLLIFIYLNTSVLSLLLSRIKFLNKYEKYNSVFSFYSAEELAKVLLFSVARTKRKGQKPLSQFLTGSQSFFYLALLSFVIQLYKTKITIADW